MWKQYSCQYSATTKRMGVSSLDAPPPWRHFFTGERKTTEVVIKRREELRGALAGWQRTSKNTNVHKKKANFEVYEAEGRRKSPLAASPRSPTAIFFVQGIIKKKERRRTGRRWMAFLRPLLFRYRSSLNPPSPPPPPPQFAWLQINKSMAPTQRSSSGISQTGGGANNDGGGAFKPKPMNKRWQLCLARGKIQLWPPRERKKNCLVIICHIVICAQ